MHLILHIFKKDVRRLWWGIVLAYLLQAVIATLDIRNETFDIPGLSLLLAVSWACLVALAVHEDPLIGDRQFWITRPVPWNILLGSKLLFAVGIVHAPSFLADVIVLAARGFYPWQWFGHLLAKQVVLAMALTLPMIALAAVLQTFAHVALALIAVGGLTAVAAGFTQVLYSGWQGVENTRLVLFFAVLVLAAAAIVPLQYARRRRWQSHLIGVAAVVLAELALCCLPPIFLARVRAATDPAHADIAFHVRPPSQHIKDWMRQLVQPFYVPPEWVLVRLPLSVSGIPADAGSIYRVSAVEVIVPGNPPYELHPNYIGPDFLMVEMPRSLYEKVRDVTIELKGSVAMFLNRPGPSTAIPVGANRPVTDAGRCSSSLVERSIYAARVASEGLRTLNIVCESPAGFPLAPRARLLPPELSTTTAELGAPYSLWGQSLSPIERVGGSFVVPRGAPPLTSAKLEITPDISLGWKVVNLDLRDIRFSDYVF